MCGFLQDYLAISEVLDVMKHGAKAPHIQYSFWHRISGAGLDIVFQIEFIMEPIPIGEYFQGRYVSEHPTFQTGKETI